jgi:hypothetical protein
MRMMQQVALVLAMSLATTASAAAAGSNDQSLTQIFAACEAKFKQCMDDCEKQFGDLIYNPFFWIIGGTDELKNCYHLCTYNHSICIGLKPGDPRIKGLSSATPSLQAAPAPFDIPGASGAVGSRAQAVPLSGSPSSILTQ